MKIRVLHLDDQPTQTRVFEATLRHESDLQHVGALHSAENLLAEVETRRPDVLVMDLELGEDAIQSIRELRQRFPTLRIVVFSGHSISEIVAETTAAGANAHVSKGADIEKLLEAIRGK